MTRTIGALVMKNFVRGLLALSLAWISMLPAQAQDGERLKVADPYLEMRTGPGRGFPVHHVDERHEFVTIELRATDWYKVRTANDKIGWVHRRQLEATLTEAGVSKSFRDTAIDDYLTRRVQFGAAVGRFKSEPMQKIWASYRLSDALTLEGTLAQVQGVFSGTDLWHANLLAEPWSDQRLSPFLGIGVGRFRNFPNQTLVGAVDTDANLANATVGVRYYLSERFVLRADYSLYTAFVSDQRSQEFRAITAGISFFFY
jgi:SH3-like domain-containing protein